jgi:hypothetical protein
MYNEVIILYLVKEINRTRLREAENERLIRLSRASRKSSFGVLIRWLSSLRKRGPAWASSWAAKIVISSIDAG